MAEKSTDIFIDLFFPRHCFNCKVLIPPSRPDTYFCVKCFGLALPNTFSRCAFCPKAVTLWKTCAKCAKDHTLDSLLVAADYKDPVIERMTKALKYRFVKIIATDIGEMMAKYLEQRASLIGLDSKNTALVPIPLYPSRLRWRGFNQAELIADSIGAKIGLPVIKNILRRTKNKTPQADIENRQERILNAEGIFIAEPNQSKKEIILVDDVATTCSTLDNAAGTLKEAGVKRVIGFVFARG